MPRGRGHITVSPSKGPKTMVQHVTVKVLGRAAVILRTLFPDFPYEKHMATMAMKRYIMDLILDDFRRRTEDIVAP